MPPKTSQKNLMRIKAWRDANRDRVLEHKRKYYRNHKDNYARWKKENPEKVKASYLRHAAKRIRKVREWELANPEKVKENHRRLDSKYRKLLTDTYVRKLIARHHGWQIAKALPKEFIETYRTIIKLKRLWENRTTSTNSATNS